MARSNVFGGAIKLDGEKEFKRAITEINAVTRANKAEMKLLSEEMKANGTNTKNLTNVQELLSDQMHSQSEKISVMEKALEKASDQYGTTSTAAMRWQTQIASAKAELLKQQQELDKTSESLKKLQSNEQVYTQTIEQANSKMQSNRAVLQLLNTEMNTNGQSTQALSKYNEVLNDNIEQQQVIFTTLQAAITKSTSVYGENGSQVQILKNKLVESKTALVQMNAELKANEQSLKKAQTGTKTLGDTLGAVTNIMGVQTSPALNTLTGRIGNVNASAATLVGILGAVTTALVKCTLDTTKAADAIMTLSVETGLSTDQLQEMEYSAERLDVSVETIQGSLSKLVKSMDSARKGSGESADAFDELGISFLDVNGKLRDNSEVFYEVIDRLGHMGDETERDAIAMSLFGESAQKLNPLISAGSAAMRDMAQEAHDVGYVMDDEMLGRFVELGDEMDKLSKAGDALKNSLAEALLPMLILLIQTIAAIPPQTLQTIVVLATTVVTIVTLVKAIKEMTDMGKGIAGFFSNINSSGTKTAVVIIGVVAAVALLVGLIMIFTGRLAELERGLGSLESSSLAMKSGIQTQSQNIPRYAKGTTYHPGGLAIVGENEAEIVDLPRGSRVYNGKQLRNMLGDNQQAATTTNNYYTFNVENIETYRQIEQKLQNEQQSARMGYAGD